MPRRKAEESDPEEDHEDNLEVGDEPPTVEPYSALGLDKTATPDQIKSAYRKAALKHHPDKASSSDKETAHAKFQEIAFAYAILSDPVRRKRYDTTGSTSESVSADDFNWTEFYSEQFRDAISSDAIERFSKAYKGSDEEKDDVLQAYQKFKGKWSGIFGTVMLSDPLSDEDRFRGYIDEAIETGDVNAFTAYTNEPASRRQKRMKEARREAEEAEEYAEELGIKDKLFGKKDGAGDKDAGLAALIKSRQAGRGDFFDHLEAKYAQPKTSSKAKKGKKRRGEVDDDDEPSEEAFQAAAAKLKKSKAGGEETNGRKAKRAKH